MSDDSAISPAPVIEAYCVKCRIKREIQHAQFVFNVRGQPVTRGACPVCGTTLFRLGDTAGHAGLTRPAPVKIEKPAQPAAAAPAGPTSAPAGLPADASAYCVKCKTRRPLGEAQAVFTARGVRAVRGACPVCGTTLFRMGEAPGHLGLVKPTPAQLKAAAHSKAIAEHQAVQAKTRAAKKAAAAQAAKSAKTGAGKKAAAAQAAKSAKTGAHGKPDNSRQPVATTRTRLVIVESPAKAKTVERILGRNYRVRASVGHVRDLLRSQLSVDTDHDFRPTYRVPNEKKDLVRQIKAEAAQAAQVFLATDPDREGEAIAWHLMEAAAIDPAATQRVIFHEITPDAVRAAFDHPRAVDMDLVNAQQTRRILDRLVGYKISPLLWDRVRSRTSAGRVQSVAVRLVVEREREIQAFVAEEYWSIEAELAQKLVVGKRAPKERPSFRARLVRIRGEEADLANEANTLGIVAALEQSSYQVSKVKLGERRRKPAPPFTTSTLQQEASRRLAFTARQTMANAQILYEGVELGNAGQIGHAGDAGNAGNAGNVGNVGNIGLITYMRTDSTNVAEVAQNQARDFIRQRYGAEFVPETPPQYKTRAKGAQEAHEAIRPTSVLYTPDLVRPYLKRELFRLYELIWQRFVASQMEPAVMDTVSVDIEAGPAAGDRPYLLRATGVRVRFAGFLVVYEETRDEDALADGDERWLPALQEDEWLDLLRLLPEQHFTQPPPRYTEATLVRTLEENGIGRPSTYAPTISTIQQRGYVERREKRLFPTELGFVVNDLLVKHFSDIIDVGFTAQMEEHLDRIADGEEAWVSVLRRFWEPFVHSLAQAEAGMEQVHVDSEPTGELCEKCGHALVFKHGRFGKFIACSNFPTCRNTKPILVKVGVACPECSGELVERKTRRNRLFYGCVNYPKCNFSSWTRPLPTPCPQCGGLLTVATKTTAKCIRCGAVTPIGEGGANEHGQ
ncbi:DNA topoisomerase [Candidatus Amarolinea dominans]|uniref:DNA topoisomerase n=1 Tax=Candidatus Amarolinea dominans TaxID=3140696 RepID=UPI0031CCBD0F